MSWASYPAEAVATLYAVRDRLVASGWPMLAREGEHTGLPQLTFTVTTIYIHPRLHEVIASHPAARTEVRGLQETLVLDNVVVKAEYAHGPSWEERADPEIDEVLACPRYLPKERRTRLFIQPPWVPSEHWATYTGLRKGGLSPADALRMAKAVDAPALI